MSYFMQYLVLYVVYKFFFDLVYQSASLENIPKESSNEPAMEPRQEEKRFLLSSL